MYSKSTHKIRKGVQLEIRNGTRPWVSNAAKTAQDIIHATLKAFKAGLTSTDARASLCPRELAPYLKHTDSTDRFDELFNVAMLSRRIESNIFFQRDNQLRLKFTFYRDKRHILACWTITFHEDRGGNARMSRLEIPEGNIRCENILRGEPVPDTGTETLPALGI